MISKKLLDALGLPHGMTWFDLTTSVGEPLLMRYGHCERDREEVLGEHLIIKEHEKDVGKNLMEALGLPNNVDYFSLSGGINEPLMMRVGHYPDLDQDAIAEALGEYKMEKK